MIFQTKTAYNEAFIDYCLKNRIKPSTEVICRFDSSSGTQGNLYRLLHWFQEQQTYGRKLKLNGSSTCWLQPIRKLEDASFRFCILQKWCLFFLEQECNKSLLKHQTGSNTVCKSLNSKYLRKKFPLVHSHNFDILNRKLEMNS